jgi:hypothetical protein
MACAPVETISRLPNFCVLGAMCQIQSMHSSPRRTPTAKAAVPGGWIDLTREGFYLSFSVMAQRLVNPPDTFFLLNGDMELNRYRKPFVQKMLKELQA